MIYGAPGGSFLDQPIVFAFIRNSFRGLARPITRPGGFYNLIELDRGGDSDSADFFPLGNQGGLRERPKPRCSSKSAPSRWILAGTGLIQIIRGYQGTGPVP